jgi:excisionase family DNA binding protein
MPRYSPSVHQRHLQAPLFEGRLGCSIDETAAALGVQRDTIYRLIADDRLTISKIGRRTIVARRLDPTAVGEDGLQAKAPRPAREARQKPSDGRHAHAPTRPSMSYGTCGRVGGVLSRAQSALSRPNVTFP